MKERKGRAEDARRELQKGGFGPAWLRSQNVESVTGKGKPQHTHTPPPAAGTIVCYESDARL